MARTLALVLTGILALLILVAALAVSCAYSPTPTNVSGGGPGSHYPDTPRSASYSHPLGGNGPQSS